MLLNIMIIAVSFIISTYLFRKSAGTLHVGKLNLISIIYYLFMLQVFAGAALIMLGYNQHYTLSKLVNREESIRIMLHVIMISAIIWPLCMVYFIKLFRIKPRLDYIHYLQRPTIQKTDKMTFRIVLAFGTLCLLLLALYIVKIGYIPLVKLLIHSEDFSFAAGRIMIGNSYIVNVYVRNLLILLAVPILSYIAFGYALVMRDKKWIVLAAVFFIASIITKTYNFEKTPVIFHLLVFVLILIYYKGGIKTKLMAPIMLGGFMILFAAYSLVGDNVTHSLYDGIGGRLLFSQVGALTYNFDMFPDILPFLAGRSFPSTVLKLVGADPDLSLRSARLLMEYYSPHGVYEGTAGVMNSFFVGEAYANFGWVGTAISVIWTALVISGFFTLINKVRKTPITLALAAYLGISVAITINGGFVDFVYNVSWFCVIGGLLLLEYLPDIVLYFKRLRKVAVKSISKPEKLEP